VCSTDRPAAPRRSPALRTLALARASTLLVVGVAGCGASDDAAAAPEEDASAVAASSALTTAEGRYVGQPYIPQILQETR
jgi:hypothetical protein